MVYALDAIESATRYKIHLIITTHKGDFVSISILL